MEDRDGREPASAPSRLVATAGHVDHGKSTIVRHLTGTEPDRLIEERQRGLSIDLGFAWTTLPSGAVISFVDVPGHSRFQSNMLAGVSVVGACVIAVSAVEGWRAQSYEHAAVLSTLEVREGVVALTHAASVNSERVAEVRQQTKEALVAANLRSFEVLAVDLPNGRGHDDLVDALDHLVRNAGERLAGLRSRVWVDRSFTIRGIGTVVTGTVTGAAISEHALLDLVTRQGLSQLRVRGLESHGAGVTFVPPGARVALNLAQTAASEVQRGDVIVSRDGWHLTPVVDASLTAFDWLSRDMTSRGAYRVHVGSGAYPVRLTVAGGLRSIPAGGNGHVRLRFERALPLELGDRFILEDMGRQELVGGGQVLDPSPVLPPGRAQPSGRVSQLVAERRWIHVQDFEKLTGLERQPDLGPWIVSDDARAAASEALLSRLTDAGDRGLEVARVGDRDRLLIDQGNLDVRVLGGRVYLGGVVGISPRAAEYRERLIAQPFSPPRPVDEGILAADMRQLVALKLVHVRDGFAFSREAVDAACALLREEFGSAPEGLTVGAIRDLLSTSRRWVLPLLGILDSLGVTVRRGEVRLPGPTLRGGRPPQESR